ncbi:MAG: hypothetical protein ACK4Z8_11770 [Novosphingobium sp.]
MNDILDMLQERLSKARARVEKSQKSLDTAIAELADVEAAIRVLSDMTGQNASGQKVSQTETVSERQANIISLLPQNDGEGIEPKALHEQFLLAHPSDGVTLDVLRTTLWRMKDRRQKFTSEGKAWIVESDNGRYWKSVSEGFDDLL